MFGQCPYCHGSLTNGHKCPGQQAAEDTLQSMTTQPMKLATMIRLWLTVKNVDQAEFAGKLGTSPAAMSRFLNGHSVPDGVTMARVIGWLLEP